MSNPSESTVIIGSVRKSAFFVYFIACLSVIAFLVWVDVVLPGSIMNILMFIAILLLGYAALGAFLMILTGKPGIKVDGTGFFDNSSFGPWGFIPWDEITGIQMNKWSILITLRDRANTLKRIKGLRRSIFRPGQRPVVSLRYIDVDTKSLEKFITAKNYVLINAALEKEPRNPEHYFCRAKAFTKENKMESAIDDYTKAIKINTEYSQAYNDRGCVYVKQQRYDLAIADFGKAIEYSAWPYEAYENRANVYMRLKDYPNAIQDYTETIEIDQDASRSFLNRAAAHYNLGRPELAIKDVETLIKKDFGWIPQAKKMLKEMKNNNKTLSWLEPKNLELALECIDIENP